MDNGYIRGSESFSLSLSKFVEFFFSLFRSSLDTGRRSSSSTCVEIYLDTSIDKDKRKEKKKRIDSLLYRDERILLSHIPIKHPKSCLHIYLRIPPYIIITCNSIHCRHR